MPTDPTPEKKSVPALKLTEEEVALALKEADGMVRTAAENLRCHHSTVYAYVKRYPALRDVLSEAREGALDLAESRLIKAIKADNLTAIIFYLKTQGRHRGYVERQEVEVAAGVKFTLNIGDRGNRDM